MHLLKIFSTTIVFTLLLAGRTTLFASDSDCTEQQILIPLETPTEATSPNTTEKATEAAEGKAEVSTTQQDVTADAATKITAEKAEQAVSAEAEGRILPGAKVYYEGKEIKGAVIRIIRPEKQKKPTTGEQ